tara:strand:- start:1699 stop:2028 length:330 start_codon:yes stop_codon:yes gene_type:complete
MRPDQYLGIAFVSYITIIVIYSHYLNYLRLVIVEILRKKYKSYYQKRVKPIVKWYNWLKFNKILADGKLDLPRDEKIIKNARRFKKYYPLFKPLMVIGIIFAFLIFFVV